MEAEEQNQYGDENEMMAKAGFRNVFLKIFDMNGAMIVSLGEDCRILSLRMEIVSYSESRKLIVAK